MNTADTTIRYSPHRILVTSCESTSPCTVRWQFMPMYGPQRWFDYEPVTQVTRTEYAGERK